MPKYYAGIGSRETPIDVRRLMTQVSSCLEKDGFILRSGGADGADISFENGVYYSDNMEIYLPWKGFNESESPLYLPWDIPKNLSDLALKYHPKPDLLKKKSVMALMARNGQQVLGKNLDSFSRFVICWTKDGKASGGTGQAIRIALDHNIKVYNMHDDSTRKKFEEYVNSNQ